MNEWEKLYLKAKFVLQNCVFNKSKSQGVFEGVKESFSDW